MQTVNFVNPIPLVGEILALVKKLSSTWHKSLTGISGKLENLYSGLQFNTTDEEARDRRLEEIGSLLSELMGHVESILAQTRDLHGKCKIKSNQGYGGTFGVRLVADLKQTSDELSRMRNKLAQLLGEVSDENLEPVVKFMGARLDRNSANMVFQLSHPGEGKTPEAELEFAGLKDELVTIEMLHVMGREYGGHLHQIEPRYLGEFISRPAGLLGSGSSGGKATFKIPRDGEGVKIIYRASDVCARRRFRITSRGLPERLQFAWT